MPIIKHSMLYTVLDFSCFVVLHLDISVGAGTRNIRTHARSHTHTHTHTHMPQPYYTHAHALGCTHTHTHTHTRTHERTHTHARMYAHTHARARTHTPAYTRRYNGVRDTDWVSHDLIRQTRGRENSTGTSSTKRISPLFPSSVPLLLDCNRKRDQILHFHRYINKMYHSFPSFHRLQSCPRLLLACRCITGTHHQRISPSSPRLLVDCHCIINTHHQRIFPSSPRLLLICRCIIGTHH